MVILRARGRDCGMYELHVEKDASSRDLRSMIRMLELYVQWTEEDEREAAKIADAKARNTT